MRKENKKNGNKRGIKDLQQQQQQSEILKSKKKKILFYKMFCIILNMLTNQQIETFRIDDLDILQIIEAIIKMKNRERKKKNFFFFSIIQMVKKRGIESLQVIDRYSYSLVVCVCRFEWISIHKQKQKKKKVKFIVQHIFFFSFISSYFDSSKMNVN